MDWNPTYLPYCHGNMKTTLKLLLSLYLGLLVQRSQNSVGVDFALSSIALSCIGHISGSRAICKKTHKSRGKSPRSGFGFVLFVSLFLEGSD